MNQLGSQAIEAKPEGFFRALFAALGSSLSGAADWTTEALVAYARRVKQVSFGLALIAVLTGFMYAFGVYRQQPWLLAVAMILSGLALSIFMLITLPIWALGAKFSELAAVRVIVRAIGFLLLMSFLVALTFLIVPITPQTALIVPLGAAIISLLGSLYGVGPNPRSIYAKVLVVMVAAIGSSLLSSKMPQTFSEMHGLAQFADKKVVDAIESQLYRPKPVPFQSSADLRSIQFFDSREGRPKVWYLLRADGSIELFDREGIHPSTGERLRAVDQAFVRQLIQQTEAREAAAKRKANNSQGAAVTAAQARPLPTPSTSPQVPPSVQASQPGPVESSSPTHVPLTAQANGRDEQIVAANLAAGEKCLKVKNYECAILRANHVLELDPSNAAAARLYERAQLLQREAIKSIRIE